MIIACHAKLAEKCLKCRLVGSDESLVGDCAKEISILKDDNRVTRRLFSKTDLKTIDSGRKPEFFQKFRIYTGKTLAGRLVGA